MAATAASSKLSDTNSPATCPLPTILYLSGHGPVVKNGISYGNKVSYQHHGAWFAQNGYVCLILDTLQLGEIQGLHHGTYREGMWSATTTARRLDISS